MGNPVKRGVVALATALCLFLALATPASANPYALTVTGGTFVAPFTTIHLAPGGSPNTPPCDQKEDTLQAELAGDASSGTMRLTGGWSSMFQLGTPPSGQWYQADVLIVNPATPQLTYAVRNPPAPPPWVYTVLSTPPNHLIFQMRIYRIPSCEKTDLACTVAVRMSFAGTLTSTAALPAYAPGGITMNGSSVGGMVVSGCAAPFSAWQLQTATVTGMTLV